MTIPKFLQIGGVLVALLAFIFVKGDVKYFIFIGLGIALVAHFFDWLKTTFGTDVSKLEAVAKKDIQRVEADAKTHGL